MRKVKKESCGEVFYDRVYDVDCKIMGLLNNSKSSLIEPAKRVVSRRVSIKLIMI